jgi:hypothetical protein
VGAGLVGAADFFTLSQPYPTAGGKAAGRGGAGIGRGDQFFFTFAALPHGRRHRRGRVGAGLVGAADFFTLSQPYRTAGTVGAGGRSLGAALPHGERRRRGGAQPYRAASAVGAGGRESESGSYAGLFAPIWLQPGSAGLVRPFPCTSTRERVLWSGRREGIGEQLGQVEIDQWGLFSQEGGDMASGTSGVGMMPNG